MMTSTLYLGDCLEVMQTLPENSIDMILTDLPYGTTRNSWDSLIPLEPLWNQYTRIAKDHAAIVLFAQVPFSQVLGASNLAMLRYEWIWKKGNASGFLNAKWCPLKVHESLLVFYRKRPTYHPQMWKADPYHRPGKGKKSSNYGKLAEQMPTQSNGERYPIDVLSFTEERGLHPTQKPIALCEYLIQTYTNRGEIVLDSCMGSGTTCIAAVRTGRRCIGIEIDANYLKTAQNRLVALQNDLFMQPNHHLKEN